VLVIWGSGEGGRARAGGSFSSYLMNFSIFRKTHKVGREPGFVEF
jgi:hypothetical protein